MSQAKPLVSIGLPVYNGANFLRQTLDSLLQQTFTDFELIIADNASTDTTQEICLEYAAKDERICYFRNEINIGAARNFNRVFELSKGKYFKWAAHDDICAPEMLERCVEILEKDSSIILCHSQTKLIIHDRQGEFKKEKNHTLKLNTDSPRANQRFDDLINISHWCFPIFGLIRTDILKKTQLIGNYAASDRGLLAELSLFGRFYEVPAYLFFYRIHPEHSVKKLAHDLSLYTSWFDPFQKGQLVFPKWRLCGAYLNAIAVAPLSIKERILCYLCVGRWFKDNWQLMQKDLLIAAKQILRPLKKYLIASKPA
jgi:glycosyltransferase involved in cell wall biosynthesis